jgi:hypothetical protein
VTTVDVWIRRAGGPDSLSLHNGLFGPATTALHALISLFRNGTISGPWHSSYIDTTISGYVIREVLVGIADDDPDFHPGDQPRLAAFLAALDDEAEYTIKAIEV